MTFAIKIAGATFTKSINILAPEEIALAKAFYLLGGSAADSVKNLAGDKAPATIVGAPSYYEGYAALSNVNGLSSAKVGNSPFTHIAVVTRGTGNVSYCGHWAAGVGQDLLGVQTNLSVAVDGSWRANLSTAPGASGFHFVAGSHNGTQAKVHLGGAGSLTTVSSSYAGGELRTAEFRVGGSGFDAATWNCAAAMTFDTALTDAQVLAFYAYLKKLLAIRNVVVF